MSEVSCFPAKARYLASSRSNTSSAGTSPPRSAGVDALLDFGLEPIPLGLAQQFLVAEQRQRIEHNLCGTVVAAALDQAPGSSRVGPALADVLVVVALGCVFHSGILAQMICQDSIAGCGFVERVNLQV